MTYSISLFHEVLSADVSHDARGQSIPHYIHHGAESVSAGEEDIWFNVPYFGASCSEHWVCF